MGKTDSMQRPPTDIVEPEMLDALRERLRPGQPALPLDAFIDCALYHPRLGYYMQDKARVGRTEHADFYTAASLGPLFTRLVIDAIDSLASTPLEKLNFVELGPESSAGLLGCLDQIPFADYIQIRPGEPLDIPPSSVVFSNELFDAQPFRRFKRQGKAWMEAHVQMDGNRLSEVYLEPVRSLPDLPKKAPENYIIDWPSGAHALLDQIGQKPWRGLFIAFDYGLDRETVFADRPEGTGRTYSGHTMGHDLLDSPGKRDITCHLLWDELQAILERCQFQHVQLQRQEAFLMHHASSTISHIIEASPPGFSRQKQTLMELLHPDNMGHKFQVLHARRGEI